MLIDSMVGTDYVARIFMCTINDGHSRPKKLQERGK